ncbi:hypothetical protein JAAARDRAFT_52477 [Jaapia argillacea MUCL 33604]|uniref:Mediator of RNA polymerase II transcription subunit 20 n=1 Tax=Jaapia argillacea MUCL 33604 TaxID=933084 RepID=A0A067QED7_9AGAM|nr:hypothetical protein JAAARDRAFT_52477 [Jaapia argillacea MUCL 33604]
MGFTGLARWQNAPTTGLEIINENIIRNHHGQYRGRWQLTIRTYRSTFSTIPAFRIHSERSLCALTMNENVFVLIDDPSAPTRADFLHHVASQTALHNQAHLQAQAEAQQQPPPLSSENPDPNPPPTAPIPPPPPPEIPAPTHYRSTFMTVRPPNALEQLLQQLRARWISVRQTTRGGDTTGAGAGAGGQRGGGAVAGQQLMIDGYVFAIGSDWLVRAGNVILAGGAVKGMLLEAEYLPLPTLHSATADGTSELISNLLTSILPNIRDSKVVAVTVSDSQWEECLWDREEEEAMRERALQQSEGKPVENAGEDDDVYAFGDEMGKEGEVKKGDWVGVDRDGRSAFLIMGALRSEGIL